MIICLHDYHACDCQPDEGVLCRKDRAMTQIDKLVKRLRATRVQIDFHRACADALTQLRERNAELEREYQRTKELVKDYDATLSGRTANIAALEARNAELEKALVLYREAVRIDPMMEGPRFAGANSSALRRAWDHDRAILSSSESVVKSKGEKDGE